MKQSLLVLEPQYREKVWGGSRLRRDGPPVGEAWAACEESKVLGGPLAGRTVAELVAEYGDGLLGADVAARYGHRFPLLIKLLDCGDWLSVQVHPNDEQARRMVGPDQWGKTEGWHFLEVEEGARIIAGVKPGTTPRDLESAIREGRVGEVARQLEVRAGETLFIPAGTLHALGPGTFLYEVQQASDTTYRVYDWDRPASAGRKLHVKEAVAVTDTRNNPTPSPARISPGVATPLLRCAFFDLDALNLNATPYAFDTEGRRFNLVTVTAGSVRVRCGDESVKLCAYETVLVAGAAGACEIRSDCEEASVLMASPSTGRLS